jgi:hypothetical protein
MATDAALDVYGLAGVVFAEGLCEWLGESRDALHDVCGLLATSRSFHESFRGDALEGREQLRAERAYVAELAACVAHRPDAAAQKAFIEVWRDLLGMLLGEDAQ